MKISQDRPQFRPITITLETREEAEALEGILRLARGRNMPAAHLAFWIDLSNWFSTEARL